MKKTLRFLLYLVVFLVVCIAFALITANSFNEFGNEFIGCIICEIFCFAGSVFFILGYDTLYHEESSKKGFFQKLFIAIGVILTVVCGVIEQIFYITQFDDAQSYSPWLYALAAPAFMAQLFTLLMYETKVKHSSWIVKYLLPYISIIVCYFIYVILGYIGSSSAFVYGGIGLIICVVLLAALVLLRRKGKPSKRRSVETEPVTQSTNSSNNSNGKLEYEDWKALKAYFNMEDSYYYYKIIDNCSYPIEGLPEGVMVDSRNITIDEKKYKCRVSVTLDTRKLSDKHTQIAGNQIYHYYDRIERDKKEAYSAVKSWFYSMVNNLPEKFGKVNFTLETKEIS